MPEPGFQWHKSPDLLSLDAKVGKRDIQDTKEVILVLQTAAMTHLYPSQRCVRNTAKTKSLNVSILARYLDITLTYAVI